MKHQTYTLSTADGTKLYTQSWLPDNPARGVLVLSHGYGEHSGRYDYVAQYFVQQGYSVYALDHRGHGKNRGRKLGYFERFASVVNDLRQFIEWVRNEEKVGPLFLLAHSMGTLAALSYVVDHQSMLKGLILSGTMLIRPEQATVAARLLAQVLSTIAPEVGWLSVDSSTLSRDEAVSKAYDSDPDVYHGKVPVRVLAEWISASDFVRANAQRITLPVLIMHGSDDKLMSPANSQELNDIIGSPDKTLKIYEGLCHEILNEPEKARVLADIWVWLASHHGTSELRTAAVRK